MAPGALNTDGIKAWTQKAEDDSGFRPRAYLTAHRITDGGGLSPLILPDTAGFVPVASGPSLSAVLVLRCPVPQCSHSESFEADGAPSCLQHVDM